MTTKAGTLELIARELGQVLAPLEQRLTGGGALELLGAVGVRLPDSVASHAQVVERHHRRGDARGRARAKGRAARRGHHGGRRGADRLRRASRSSTERARCSARCAISRRLCRRPPRRSRPRRRAALQPLIADIGRRLFDFLVIEHFENEVAPSRPGAHAAGRHRSRLRARRSRQPHVGAVHAPRAADRSAGRPAVEPAAVSRDHISASAP